MSEHVVYGYVSAGPLTVTPADDGYVHVALVGDGMYLDAAGVRQVIRALTAAISEARDEKPPERSENSTA